MNGAVDLMAIAQQMKDKPKTTDYQKALYAKPKPVSEYNDFLNYILPLFNTAIKKAENNPRNFGVLSEKVNSPDEANKILNQSIKNNFWRWIGAGRPNKFVDFMRDRWAPLGASNDQNNLNSNWSPNVRKFLFQQLSPEEEKMWKVLNLVKLFNNV